MNLRSTMKARGVPSGMSLCRPLATCLALFCMACGTSAPVDGPVTPTTHAVEDTPPEPETTPEAVTSMVDGFFTAEGAPPPLTCSVDEDCFGDTVSTEGGCCNDPRTLRQYSRAYRHWVEGWRRDHCADVTCPPPPPPARPRDCLLRARCHEGQCTDTCGQGLSKRPVAPRMG